MTQLRLFIAIELPNTLQETIRAVTKTLQSKLPSRVIRWVQPENLHLTLKFLGDTPEGDVEKISTALERATQGHSAFQIEIEGTGCFPNEKKPRVIWLGLKDSHQQLSRLHQSVNKEIRFPHDENRFHPHLTLGRVKDQAAANDLLRIGQGLRQANIQKVAPWPCTAIHLMQSELTPAGPIYTSLIHIQLQ